MKLDDIRRDIDYRRNQIVRQMKDIRTLQRAGINSLPAEALLARMQAKVDDLCAERDELPVATFEAPYNGDGKRYRDVSH